MGNQAETVLTTGQLDRETTVIPVVHQQTHNACFYVYHALSVGGASSCQLVRSAPVC